MKKNEVIGIDVSKLTIDVYIHTLGIYRSFDNDFKGFKAMMEWIKIHFAYPLSETIFVFENTGIYSEHLCKFLDHQKLLFYIASGLEVKRSMGIVRGKSDPVDAKRIAQFGFRIKEEISFSQATPSHIKRLQSMMSLRNRLVKQRSGYKSCYKEQKRIYNKKDFKMIFEVQESMIKVLNKQIKKIENEIKHLILGNKNTKLIYKQICSIKSVGPQTAIAMIVYTACFTKFKTWRKFASYAGIAPYPYQSGTSINGKSKVSHLANKHIKSLLHLCTMSAIQFNSEMKKYYNRRIEAGKNKMSTINIIRNKLVSRMFAIVNRGTPYVDTLLYTS